jgi:type IV pilus assembly protein PilA
MLARMQKSLKEKDQGFTLIELLVVIVIIGILAAIAIPIFLNQQKKGVDSSLKSDLKSAATTVETWRVDHPSDAITPDTVESDESVTPGTATTALGDFKASSGNTIKVVPVSGTGNLGAYCIYGYNPKASDATSATNVYIYNSLKGGLQADVTAPACTA